MRFFEDFQELSDSRQFLQESHDLEHFTSCRNPVCGDEVFIKAELKDGIIVSLAYQAKACLSLIHI